MARRIAPTLLLMAASALTGCAQLSGALPAATPTASTAAPLFNDSLFAPPAQPVSTAGVLALSPEMRRFLDDEIRPQARRIGGLDALSEALLSRNKLLLDYEADRTRSASEAFAARAGNCLSLVLMTAAFAQALELPVRFQNVLSEEAWDRVGDLFFYIGHVNLRLGARLGQQAHGSSMHWTTIDFEPGADLARQHVQVIGEERVLAMYANNLAAEALAVGRLDDAYAWVREAVKRDASFLNAYNTLGVIYSRRGALPLAERAFRFALAADRANVHVMGNLATLLQRTGREAEAAPLLAEVKRLQPLPPFALFEQGRQAAARGDWQAARRFFEREIARAPAHHEFHFWLGRALAELGDSKGAAQQMQLAAEHSKTREQGALYTAKAERLRGSVVR
jgi:tetratricopeptide (TPR) repeat protein